MRNDRFNRTLEINEIGIQETYNNNKLIKVIPVKLVSYNEKEDCYRFQLGNKDSEDFLNVSGKCYPFHIYNQEEDLEIKTIIKSIK